MNLKILRDILEHLLVSPVDESPKEQSDGALHVSGAQPAPLVPDQQAQDVQSHLSQRRLRSCVEKTKRAKDAEFHTHFRCCT